MPDCPISAPPSVLAVPLPWEAPLSWLVFAGTTVVLIGLLGLLYRSLRRRYRPSAWRTRAGAAWSAGVACGLAVNFIQVLMVRPSLNRVSDWAWGQYARFAASACDLHVLQATANRLYGDQHALFLVTEGLLGAWMLFTLAGVFLLAAAQYTPAAAEREG